MLRMLACTLVLVVGCGGESSQEDSCEIGLRIHRDALAAAQQRAPACVDSSDCAVMREEIGCPGVVEITLCDVAVHKLVLDYYDREAVAAAMCEATDGSELGCSLSASCTVHGGPECIAGECTFRD